MKNNEKGFGAIEGLLIAVIVCLLGFVGWYVYQSNSKASKSLNAANTASSSNVSKTNNPTAGWKTYCDSKSKTCLYYPPTWSAKAGLGNEGITITDPGNSVVVYENPNPGNCASSQPGIMSQFYVNSVNKVSTRSLSLEVVGGYFNSKLNGAPNYNPSYTVTNTKYVNQYSVKAGSTVNFPEAWTCYNYAVIVGEASSQPTGLNSYNATSQDASSWFNTSQAKTSLRILQSIYAE